MNDARLRQTWDPWAVIPAEYNLGVDLTAGQAGRGRGSKPALLWENAAGAVRSYTYGSSTPSAAASPIRSAVSASAAATASSFAYPAGRSSMSPLWGSPSSRRLHPDQPAIPRIRDPLPPPGLRSRRRRQHAALVEAVQRVWSDCPALQNVIVVEDEDGDATADMLSFKSLIDQGASTLPGRHAERRHGLHRLHFRHHRRPQGRRSPAPLPHRLRWVGALVARLPSRRRGRLPVRAGLAAAGRLHLPLRPGQGADRGAVRRPGRPVQPAAWLSLIQKYRVSNFTAPPSVYRLFTTLGDAIRTFDLSTGGTPSAPANLCRPTRWPRFSARSASRRWTASG